MFYTLIKHRFLTNQSICRVPSILQCTRMTVPWYPASVHFMPPLDIELIHCQGADESDKPGKKEIKRATKLLYLHLPDLAI